jgi:hypothetical protein
VLARGEQRRDVGLPRLTRGDGAAGRRPGEQAPEHGHGETRRGETAMDGVHEGLLRERASRSYGRARDRSEPGYHPASRMVGKEACMPFGTLWLPVIVSAIVVFLASSVLHMVLRYHRADHKPLPNEAAVAEALGKGRLAPGKYVIPHCGDPKQLKDPQVVARYTTGPVAIVSVLRNGPPAMGAYLGLWFLFCLLASFVTAYVARLTLAPATAGLEVLRVTGAVAFAGYALGHVQDSIWHGQPWSNTVRGVVDAVIYAVLTGLTFRLLWPGS